MTGGCVVVGVDPRDVVVLVDVLDVSLVELLGASDGVVLVDGHAAVAPVEVSDAGDVVLLAAPVSLGVLLEPADVVVVLDARVSLVVADDEVTVVVVASVVEVLVLGASVVVVVVVVLVVVVVVVVVLVVVVVVGVAVVVVVVVGVERGQVQSPRHWPRHMASSVVSHCSPGPFITPSPHAGAGPQAHVVAMRTLGPLPANSRESYTTPSSTPLSRAKQ